MQSMAAGAVQAFRRRVVFRHRLEPLGMWFVPKNSSVFWCRHQTTVLRHLIEYRSAWKSNTPRLARSHCCDAPTRQFDSCFGAAFGAFDVLCRGPGNAYGCRLLL